MFFTFKLRHFVIKEAIALHTSSCSLQRCAHHTIAQTPAQVQGNQTSRRTYSISSVVKGSFLYGLRSYDFSCDLPQHIPAHTSVPIFSQYSCEIGRSFSTGNSQVRNPSFVRSVTIHFFTQVLSENFLGELRTVQTVYQLEYLWGL